MDESATLHQDIILGIGSDPERLELAYQEALKAGEGDAFAAALLAAHAASPDDLLYSAWRYRLAQGWRRRWRSPNRG
ncbi:MAG: hypothetical protein IPJ58_02865 [Ardenticatenia bacterium]|nr:hypothetical protein [Ardenticatenia bacterium]